MWQVWAEWVGLEGEGKERGDERWASVVPAGPWCWFLSSGLLSLPIRCGMWRRGSILVGLLGYKQSFFCLFFLSFISTFLSYSSAMKCSWRVKCGGKDSESSSSRYCSSSQTGRKPWSYAGSRGSLMLRPWQTAGKLKRFLFDVRNINFVGILNRRKHLLFVR